MKNIQLLNKIAKVGTDKFDAALYNVGTDIENPDGIMVRSANMLDMTFNGNLLAIARAGAGVNNIPLEVCAEQGIVVFNTPGANANGVKELTLCAMLLAARDVIGGAEWVSTLAGDENCAKTVEKGKSNFAGTELKGKTLGVIGLGAIGGLVANMAIHLGMRVIGCDPFLSVEGAWNLDRHIQRAATFGEVFAEADYVTLHVPATPDTKGMINEAVLNGMKDGVRIINLSRDSLVKSDDIKAALASGKVAKYVTDFATPEMIGVRNVIITPHLGASTEESEDNCAVMAAMELDDYIQNGNIRNSVNYPAVSMPRSTAQRVCVLHKNIPGILNQLTSAVSESGINIENMTNKSRGAFAYTMMDVCDSVSDEIIASLAATEGVLKIRTV